MKKHLVSLFALLLAAGPVSAAYILFPQGDSGLKADTKSAYDSYRAGDYAKALAAFKAEAARGDKDAQFAMGRLYEEGRAVAPSLEEAEGWYRKAMKSGHTEAQFNLAVVLLRAPNRGKEGLEVLQQCAASGNSRALLEMGTLYVTGNGVEKNTAKGKAMLEQASAKGEATAFETLGLMYESGEGVEKSDAKAVENYENAARKSNLKAMLRLAVKYSNGTGVPKDLAKAKEWLVKAADFNSTDAMLALGLMYETGNGVEKNPEEAVRWLTKAGEAGEANALAKLGMMYAEGSGVAKDEKAAFSWSSKAAEKGSAAGMYALSTAYAKGAGVTASPGESLKYLIAAATSNLPLAMRELAGRYRAGKEVAKDTIVAQSWYTRATYAGDAESALTVVDMLLSGEGGLPPDAKTAKVILTKAAELGIAEAQLKLAEFHEKGLDGRPDLIRAYAVVLATGDKFEPGLKKKAALEKLMTKEQIEQGKKEYDRIKAQPAAAPAGEGKKPDPAPVK